MVRPVLDSDSDSDSDSNGGEEEEDEKQAPDYLLSLSRQHNPPGETFEHYWVTTRNFVSTFTTGMSFDLTKVAMHLGGKYGKVFPSCVCINHAPRATVSIFQSGMIVVTGTTTYMDSALIAHLYAWRLSDICKEPVRVISLHTDNIVASAGLGIPVDLDLLYIDFQHYSTYEPKNFPGLTLRFEDMKVSVILFESGKMNVTGAKVISQSRDAYLRVLEFIHKYHKIKPYRVLPPNERRSKYKRRANTGTKKRVRRGCRIQGGTADDEDDVALNEPDSTIPRKRIRCKRFVDPLVERRDFEDASLGGVMFEIVS